MTRLSLILAGALVAFSAQAEYFTEDANYVYREIPYTETQSAEDIVQITAQIAQSALVNVLKSGAEKGIFPQDVMTVEDIDQLKAAQDKVSTAVRYLNNFVKEERNRQGWFSDVDLYPDAFVVFGGKKISLNLGAGVGASVSLGAIIIPVYVEKYDKRTGVLVDESWSVRLGVVAWPAGDVGAAVGGGTAFRLGVGFIWDLNDAFVKPDQFWGVGVGGSWSPLTAIGGANVSAGVVSNWTMPGWVDFLYATVALELGPNFEVGLPRLNATTFISGPALMALLDRSSQKVFEDQLKSIEKSLTQTIIKEMEAREQNIPVK